MRPETRQSAGLDPAGRKALQECLQDDDMPVVFNMNVRVPKRITGECNLGVCAGGGVVGKQGRWGCGFNRDSVKNIPNSINQ